MTHDGTEPAGTAGPGGLPETPPAVARLFGDRAPLARRYAEELATTGIAHGLVGPREAPRLWERHVLNCVLLERLLAPGSSVIDVGSGAGLPGIVLAVARPDLTVHLVEPLLRRTTWLERTVDLLGLDNAVVHRGRAEQVRLSAPVVTARAVAALPTLVEWSLPLLEPQGRLLALKGAAAEEELAAAGTLLRTMGVEGAKVLRLEEEGVDPVSVVQIVRPKQLLADGSAGGGPAGGGRARTRRAGGKRAQGRRGKG
ncbi:16S rRNA (guanine(527)-N(7))-methyltransferase RsmG [Ornithinimicrobium sp. W1679]|uniref:16S rRNA (guanine(527)-N(7))-methyltransferase RsmG n=1 Tax=Ornithinimicrobium sp. W1679 TaxID=3418770 RepID=UPI003CF22652